jgi:hypothetical protein
LLPEQDKPAATFGTSLSYGSFQQHASLLAASLNAIAAGIKIGECHFCRDVALTNAGPE